MEKLDAIPPVVDAQDARHPSGEVEWGLVDAFETEGMTGTAEHGFVLGAEWSAFRQKVLAGGAFSMPVHEENVQRMLHTAENHRRTAHARPPKDDGWNLIEVDA